MSGAKPGRAVALYSPGWPPGRVANGIVSYVGALAKSLKERGRAAYVIAASVAGDSSEPPDVNLSDLRPCPRVEWAERQISRIPPLNAAGLPLALHLASGVADLLARRPCGLLEVEESFGISWFVQRMVKIPIVVRLHGPWFLNGAALGVPLDAIYERRNAAEKRAIASAEGITAPSANVLEAVRQRHGLDLPFAAVIPNAAPVTPANRRWSLAGSDRKTVLFVGRFDRHKGGDIAIDAFVRIARACPDSRLVFVGPDRGVSDASGATLTIGRYIQTRVPPDVIPRIEVRGAMAAEDIEPLRRSSLVTVMASRYENFSLALLEALSLGCPTVASATGGNPEIVLDGRTGLLCEPDDPESLARTTIELLKHPLRAAELGRAAALDMSSRLSPQSIADRTWAFYEDVWARSSPTVRLRLPGSIVARLHSRAPRAGALFTVPR